MSLISSFGACQWGCYLKGTAFVSPFREMKLFQYLLDLELELELELILELELELILCCTWGKKKSLF